MFNLRFLAQLLSGSLRNCNFQAALVGMSFVLLGFGNCQCQAFTRSPQSASVRKDFWTQLTNEKIVNAIQREEQLKNISWENLCFDVVEFSMTELNNRVLGDNEVEHLFKQFGKHGDEMDFVWFSVVAPLLFELEMHDPSDNIKANAKKFKDSAIRFICKERSFALRFQQSYAWSSYSRLSGLGSSQMFESLLSELGRIRQAAQLLGQQASPATEEIQSLNLRIALAFVATNNFEELIENHPNNNTKRSCLDFCKHLEQTLSPSWLITGKFCIYLDSEERVWKRSFFKLSMFQVSVLLNQHQWVDLEKLMQAFSVSNFRRGYGNLFRSTGSRYAKPFNSWTHENVNFQLVAAAAGLAAEVWQEN